MLQESGLISQRAQSTTQMLGPSLFFDQQLDIYQKNVESHDSLRMPSNESEHCIQKNQKQIEHLKINFNTNRNQKSFSRRKIQNPTLEKRGDSQSQKKNEGNVFIKSLLKNAHIAYFKNILFEHSYVLPTKLKHILATESYLTEDILKKKKSNNDQQIPWLIFLPGDKRMIIWDQISLIMNLICLWISPFVACFNSVVLLYHALEIVIILFLVLDILICFNRAIIEQGEILTERKIIFHNYIHSHFLQDLASILLWLLCCLEIYKITVANEIIFVLQLTLVLIKLKKNYANYIEQLYLKGAFNNSVDIISLVFSIYFFAHFMACAWHYIGIQTDNLGVTWLSKNNLLEQNEYFRYNYSFYWATVTMVTVGYGDIIPQNYVEMMFVNFIIIVSSFMYAYSLNSIGIILKSYNDQREKYTRQLIMINSYMRKNSIDETIQNRVRNYIKYQMGSQYNENSDSVNQFINDLPIGLRNELSSDLQTKIISKMKIINQIFSKQTTKALVNQLKFTKLTPNDFVYHRGDPNEQNLYYVDEGEINVIEENSKKILEVKRKGDVFGKYQFFTGQAPKCSAISTQFSQIYQIRRSEFINLIRYFQKDFEKFNNIKDALLFNQTNGVFFESCNICKRMSHISIECPLLTYQPNLEQRIKKSLFNTYQDRNEKYQRQNQKQQFRCIFQDFQSTVKQFQQKQEMQVSAPEIPDGSATQIDSPVQIYRQNKSKKTTIQPRFQKEISDADDDSQQIPSMTSGQEKFEKPKVSRKSKLINTIIVQKLDQQRKTNFRINNDLKINSTQLDIKICENQNFLEEFSQEMQFLNNDLDKLQIYQYYKAHGNVDEVIRNIEQFRKKKSKHNFKSKNFLASAYTFNQSVVQKILNRTKLFIKFS